MRNWRIIIHGIIIHVLQKVPSLPFTLVTPPVFHAQKEEKVKKEKEKKGVKSQISATPQCNGYLSSIHKFQQAKRQPIPPLAEYAIMQPTIRPYMYEEPDLPSIQKESPR